MLSRDKFSGGIRSMFLWPHVVCLALCIWHDHHDQKAAIHKPGRSVSRDDPVCT